MWPSKYWPSSYWINEYWPKVGKDGGHGGGGIAIDRKRMMIRMLLLSELERQYGEEMQRANLRSQKFKESLTIQKTAEVYSQLRQNQQNAVATYAILLAEV